MGRPGPEIFRIFLIGSLMIVVSAILMVIISDDCLYGPISVITILVLYRVVTGGRR
jgi:hypothetical protein